MKPDEIKKLAIECGLVNGVDVESKFLDWKKEIEAYTTAVEAPLQARIAQLENALTVANEYMPIYGRSEEVNKHIDIVNKVLDEPTSTWLSDHDKEVEARERERCISAVDRVMVTDHGLNTFKRCMKTLRELK